MSSKFTSLDDKLPDLLDLPAGVDDELVPEGVEVDGDGAEATELEVTEPDDQPAEHTTAGADGPQLAAPDTKRQGVSRGDYKVVVSIPAEVDDVLTGALIGKRWPVGKKVGKLSVYRAVLLMVLERIDFSTLEYSDPDTLEGAIFEVLVAQR